MNKISEREYKGFKLIKIRIYANIFIWHIEKDGERIKALYKLSMCKRYIDRLTHYPSTEDNRIRSDCRV